MFDQNKCLLLCENERLFNTVGQHIFDEKRAMAQGMSIDVRKELGVRRLCAKDILAMVENTVDHDDNDELLFEWLQQALVCMQRGFHFSFFENVYFFNVFICSCLF